MAKVTYIEHDGEVHEANIDADTSLMEGAVQLGLEGIIAECGGACACATCHCYIAEEWVDKIEPATDIEAAMLDAVIDPKPNSRLACQINVTDAISGIVVHLPKDQL